MSSLNQALRAALDNRHQLLAELHTQGTDCYRLFHGSQEGAGGLTIDRYGPQLLVQSFHQRLERDDLLQLHEAINRHLGLDLMLVYNDRSQGNSRIDREDTVYRADEAALADTVGHEWGLKYRVRGRHADKIRCCFSTCAMLAAGSSNTAPAKAYSTCFPTPAASA